MKFYGLAVAAIPHKTKTNILRIFVNPVALCKENQEQILLGMERQGWEVDEELRGYAFVHELNLDDPFDVAQSFAKFVRGLERVAALQHASCNSAGISYRPVALMLGQDSRANLIHENEDDPRHYDKFYFSLFGHLHSIVEKEGYMSNASVPGMTDLERELDKMLYFAYMDEGKLKALVEKAKAHEVILERRLNDLSYKSDISSVVLTYEKFSKLLNECSLSWGSFTPGIIPTEQEQKPLDLALIKLRPSLSDKNEKRRQKAKKDIIALAMQDGKSTAERANVKQGLFKLGHLPEGYMEQNEKGQALRKKYPSYEYLEWDCDFKQAFHQSFQAYYKGQCTRTIKTFMDPSMPPFVDPVADCIRDQFQIVDRARASADINDDIGNRATLAASAQKYICMLKSMTANKLPAAMVTDVSIEAKKNSLYL